MDWRDIWKDITDSVLEGIWGMNKKDPRALLGLCLALSCALQEESVFIQMLN